MSDIGFLAILMSVAVICFAAILITMIKNDSKI